MIWVQINFHTFLISSKMVLYAFSALFLAYISTQEKCTSMFCVCLESWDVEGPWKVSIESHHFENYSMFYVVNVEKKS